MSHDPAENEVLTLAAEPSKTDSRGRCALATGSAPMRFAYADPPYLGQGVKHYGDRHADAADCDTIEWHAALVGRLCDEYPDGWAMSLSSPTLKRILAICPDDCRVMAWVKPFAAFKPNVGLAYAWEPVIARGGRKIGRGQPTVRDWHSENITLKKGFPGAKPPRFTRWILEVLNASPDDTIDDLFPGSGAVQREIEAWREECAFLQNVEMSGAPEKRTNP